MAYNTAIRSNYLADFHIKLIFEAATFVTTSNILQPGSENLFIIFGFNIHNEKEETEFFDVQSLSEVSTGEVEMSHEFRCTSTLEICPENVKMMVIED